MTKTLGRLAPLLLLAVAIPAIPGETAANAATPATPAVERTAPAAPAPAPARAASLLDELHAEAPRLDRDVLRLALHAREQARAEGKVKNDVLTVIDYSLPSTEERMWVFDMEDKALLWEELVSHGQGSGGDMATRFSNVNNSHQTSLGLFTTAESYHGKNGYSLRLHGHDKGLNDLAFKRAIVIHGAPYVSRDFIAQQGRLGRSWGCPAVEANKARPIIDRIKGGSLVFSYYPEQTLLASRYLNGAGETGGSLSADAVAAQ